MKSMTGFGRGEASGDNFFVSAEIKTVNNRYLDLHLRLPNELQPIEPKLKKIAANRISRGRADINIQYERDSVVEYEINRPLVTGFLSALKEVKDEFDLKGEPNLNAIVKLPNALVAKRKDLSEDFIEGVYAAFEEALNGLDLMRTNEGESLKADFNSILDRIEELIPAIEKEAETVPQEYRERLSKKIEHILSKEEIPTEVDQARLAQEVAFLSEKADIAEEITRLRSHIIQFRDILDEDGAIGKRLDFLTQELNREANTIASKTNNLIIKESALRLKSEIEKIREQVQNIE